jgi:carbon-monoxide dehydrogenase small subunit
MKKTLVEATINGETVEFLCEPRQSLLETLRDVLELTGSKEGCLTGDCGACTVLVDGRSVCSCLMLGVEAQGKNIATVEGLATQGVLSVLQIVKAVLDAAADIRSQGDRTAAAG